MFGDKRTRLRLIVPLFKFGFGHTSAFATLSTECEIKTYRRNYFQLSSWTETILRSAQTNVIWVSKSQSEQKGF